MDTITIRPYNRTSQPTPVHEFAAAIISPLCYRCLLPHRQDDEDEEDILYAIPEIEEEDDEEYVVLNTEEGGLIEVLITIEANVHFEVDSTLAEEEWSIIVDKVSLGDEDDLVFVDMSHGNDVEIAPASVSGPRSARLRQK
ncbi:hypothetical protein JOM56_010337 [Amanita muscaria]